ncbi:hypothetical protein BDP81DRAFT_206546 [Colletotrichum phormii]|uniref:Uncharacterized protein n=1 Tax=Colletotrichum phormii TaxID=359342 RepID=A0AAJ0EIR7_9PEZI|nr:uncharacterized protein BDP81DRAFT_206546 [Colletotrichum phormii]KAK1638336.1 hypothetical protein BDP81DRAFT_206546 [Colletotrichum phormii]
MFMDGFSWVPLPGQISQMSWPLPRVPAATATAAAAAMIQEASGPVRRTHVPLGVRQGTEREYLHAPSSPQGKKDSYRLLSRIVLFPFIYFENITITSLFQFLDFFLNAFSTPSQEFNSRYWVRRTNQNRYVSVIQRVLSLSISHSVAVSLSIRVRFVCFFIVSVVLLFFFYVILWPFLSPQAETNHLNPAVYHCTWP